MLNDELMKKMIVSGRETETGEDVREEVLYVLWLSLIQGIGNITSNRLISALGAGKGVYTANREVLSTVKGLNTNKIENILESRSLNEAEAIIERCKMLGIGILLPGSGLLPGLRDLREDSPQLLFYKGQIDAPLSLNRTVGIIGPRRCSQSLKWRTAKIAEEYTKAGYSIISGMAKGVDSYAQTACINAGGFTIAVVGNGLDICYPKEHLRLMDSIKQNGLILSEYPPGVPAARYNFPRRNRIIAALCGELVVMEPGAKSGTSSTIGWAEKIGRNVRTIR